MATRIDFSPLFIPVAKDEVSRFRRESKERRESWAGNRYAVIAYAFIGVFLLGWMILMYSIIGRGGFGGSASSVVPMVVVIAVVAAVAVGGWLVLRAGRWEKLLRRTRFATANGLVYVDSLAATAYPGVIFDIGSSRRTTGNYRRPLAPELDIGSYQYTTGSGKNRTTHQWGYVALRMPRKLPNMLLDARSNNGLFGTSNLPLAFSRDQVLSLEGDFDRYFTLYCPIAYERDALYVFTPDLMALLIDESAAFDVEIVDDWMFLYSRGAMNIDDPATLQRIFTIIDTVGEKAQRQTQRYADERVGDPRVDYVAPRGQRLRRGRAWVTIGSVLIVAWVGFSILRAFVF